MRGIRRRRPGAIIPSSAYLPPRCQPQGTCVKSEILRPPTEIVLCVGLNLTILPLSFHLSPSYRTQMNALSTNVHPHSPFSLSEYFNTSPVELSRQFRTRLPICGLQMLFCKIIKKIPYLGSNKTGNCARAENYIFTYLFAFMHLFEPRFGTAPASQFPPNECLRGT